MEGCDTMNEYKDMDLNYIERLKSYSNVDTVQAFKLNPEATIPTRTHTTDAGIDIYSVEDVFIPHNATVKVNTGIAIRIPEGYVGKIEDRSSMAIKGLRTGAGVVDSGYSGELGIVLHNLTNTDELSYNKYNNFNEFGYTVKKGSKIAQLLVYKIETPAVVEVNELWTSQRGERGFGSSGV